MSRPSYELDNVPSQSSTFQQMALSNTTYLFRAPINPEPGFTARRDNDIEIEPTQESVSHFIDYGGNSVASSKSVVHVREQRKRHSPDSKSYMRVGERRSRTSPNFTSKSVMRGEERRNHHSPDRITSSWVALGGVISNDGSVGASQNSRNSVLSAVTRGLTGLADLSAFRTPSGGYY